MHLKVTNIQTLRWSPAELSAPSNKAATASSFSLKIELLWRENYPQRPKPPFCAKQIFLCCNVLGYFTMIMGTALLFELERRNHWRSCSFQHFHVGFLFQPQQLPLDCILHTDTNSVWTLLSHQCFLILVLQPSLSLLLCFSLTLFIWFFSFLLRLFEGGEPTEVWGWDNNTHVTYLAAQTTESIS